MTSDSVASFLDLARDQGLLPREQVEDLFRQPDMPHSDLQALCGFLEKRGVLTPYQAEKIRHGLGYELTFAGYPILGEYGLCPGGTAFKASHPSLRTPLIIRRLRAEWLAPADNISAYVQRAQSAAPIAHPNLGHLLDAGVSQDEAFVVLEPFDGGDLENLIADIGPMPANLAADYAKQVALGLEAAHSRGIFHGDVCPANIVAGPIVATSRTRVDGSPRKRPAPNATIKLMELGLVPLRTSATGEYLPPERATVSAPTAAGDVYMLGGSLYYLLTAKSPASIAPLAALRPDVPLPFVALIEEMMAQTPADRPSIQKCISALHVFTKPQPPKPDTGEVKLTAANTGEVDLVPAEPSEVDLVPMSHEPAPAEFAEHSDVYPASFAPPQYAEANNYWGQPAAAPVEFVPSALDPSQYAAAPQPAAPREPRPAPAPKRSNRQQLYMWLGAGLILQIAAVVIWYFVIRGTSEPEPDNTPAPAATKKAVPPKKPKPQAGS